MLLTSPSVAQAPRSDSPDHTACKRGLAVRFAKAAGPAVKAVGARVPGRINSEITAHSIGPLDPGHGTRPRHRADVDPHLAADLVGRWRPARQVLRSLRRSSSSLPPHTPRLGSSRTRTGDRHPAQGRTGTAPSPRRSGRWPSPCCRPERTGSHRCADRRPGLASCRCPTRRLGSRTRSSSVSLSGRTIRDGTGWQASTG